MYRRHRNNFLSSNLQNGSRRQTGTPNSSRWERSEERQSTDSKTEKTFSETTTIHGIRFLTESNRPFYEKIFWLVIMIFVSYCMVRTITNQIRNYLNNPVLMNIDGAMIQITDIPFPALTFCSDNQVHPSLLNITDLLNKQNLTDDEYDKLEIGLTLCSDLKLKPKLFALQKDKTVVDLRRRLKLYGAGNCKRTVDLFLWEQKPVLEPCKYFQVTTTQLGVCYTFNMLPANQLYTEAYFNDISMFGGLLSQDYKYFQSKKAWDLDSGYMAGDGDEIDDGAVFPWRLSSMKFQLLPVVFYLDLNVDDMEHRCITGHTFTVAVHNPAEPPTIYSTITQAVTDRGNYIRILPKVVTTSKVLQSWSPKDRGCYFNDEKKLKYFKIYTMHNCEIECTTNITLKECNCSFIGQPHLHSTPVCKSDKMQCYKESYLVKTLDSENKCDCLPSCTELTYDIDYFNLPDKFKEFGQNNRKIPKNLASFFALYKTSRIKSVQRVAVVITSDIIANIGGLMGLFLGFSVISLFEIIYFFVNWVIRILKNIWK